MTYYWGFHPDIVGRQLASVEVSPDRERLKLTFMDGLTDIYQTEGDCCSETWIEHLTVPPDIEGATITSITTDPYDGRVATPEQEAESRAHHEYIDVLLVYQSVIATDRGEVIVEYRNSSNGYYGGSLRRVGSR